MRESRFFQRFSSFSTSVVFISFTLFCCHVLGHDLQKKQVLAPRQLLPYQAYKDVQLFHYAVPEQVSIGEWQFRTNLTKTCGEPIEVTVTLQHGSYPVVSSDSENSVDSSIVATPRQPVRVLQLNPDDKQPSTINVTSPMPGDWFAAAFYSSANPNRKRWRLRCEVLLSSTATFHIDGSVVLLITEYPMNQKIIGIQRYRFFASESMWFARITLTECDPCPVTLSFQPRVFPTEERALSRVDCTIAECALEVAVAEDDWNYIVVEPQEPGIITYRIEVQSAICPMEGAGDQYNEFTIQPVPKPIIKMRNGSECSPSVSESFGTLNARHCYSRLELIRQKLPGNFAFRYSRLSGYSFVSPVVNISTLHPSLAMFRVMPIVDIGGTFTVEADLPPLSVAGNTKLSVEACLQYNERPHITDDGICSAGFGMYLNTSTTNSSNGKLMVPFPEAGLWYLLLKPRCYIEKEGRYRIQTIYVPCPTNTTPVVLRLESGPCSLGQCGEYGRCYQYLSGGLVFSSCLCTAGRKGWDCGDDSEAHTYAQLLVTVLLLTVSNILYLPVTVLAIYRRYFTEALVYVTAMVFSALFHACDFEVSPFCVIRLSVLQYCDVYASVLAVWITMVALADLPTSGRSLSNMVGALGLAVGVEYDRTGFWVFLVPIGAGLFLASFSWGFHCYYQRRCFVHKLSWFRLMIGFGLMASGLVLFAMFEGHPNYAYVHSGRHACFALALLFLLPGRKSTKGMQDGINTCSYIRVEELSDISHPLECGVYQHLLTPTP